MTATEVALIVMFLAGMFAGMFAGAGAVYYWEDWRDGRDG